VSGPYCPTCKHFNRAMRGAGGECNDPTKRIYYKHGDAKNETPEVSDTDSCPNWTSQEKDSAGPTPRTNAAVITRSVVIDNNLCDVDCVEPDFARTLERELTASESLLTRARDTLWFLGESHYDDRASSIADRIDKHLTPPVAGGEG
jgi:hypothetical protein